MNHKKHEGFRKGDKVKWHIDDPSKWEGWGWIISTNKTHAHIKNIHGVMVWVLLEKVTKTDSVFTMQAWTTTK